LLEAAKAPPEQQEAVIIDLAAGKSAGRGVKASRHEKAKAAWRVAACCAECLPREKWPQFLCLLFLAGADSIAEAFAAITDLPIPDQSALDQEANDLRQAA
jgi:hypothetical protein